MQGNRIIRIGTPHWLSLRMALDGINKSKKTSGSAGEPLRLLAATTDLEQSRIRVSDYARDDAIGKVGPLQMDRPVPILALCGKRGSAQPYLPNAGDFVLAAQNRMRVEVTPAAGEVRGHVVFMFSAERTQPQAVQLAPGTASFFFSLSAKFTGDAEQQTTDETIPYEDDLLIIGAHTDLASRSAGVRITDHTGTAWCPATEFVPLWAMAGYPGAAIPHMRWGFGYRLPAGEILKATFQNAAAADGAVSNGTLTFEAIRLRKQR